MKRVLTHPSLPLVMGVLALAAGILIMLAMHFLPGLFSAKAAGDRVQSVVTNTPAASLPNDAEKGQATPTSGSYVLEVRDRYLKEKKTFIEADLSGMELRVYKDGEKIIDVPIKTKGREGSWWETPVGVYSVKLKEENHFSTIGHVYQPWSLIFQGNFFIHGWPYYPDGSPVSSKYSGGCIRLTDEDAKLVYDTVEVGTPVLIYKAPRQAAALPEFDGNPDIDGTYVVLDVPTGTTIRSSDAGAQVPFGAAVNLMTALTAVDYINVESLVYVNDVASPRLADQERVSVLDLLRLLLSEGDVDAARTIASARSESAFIRYMNAKAAAIGMAHTTIVSVDPADSGNVTTPGDIALLARYLDENRSFVLQLSKSSRGNLAYDPPIWDDLDFDDNLLGLPGFFGGVRGGNGGPTVAVLSVPASSGARGVVIVGDSPKDIAAAAAWLTQ